MRNPLVAALANFFLPGAGYLLTGTKRALGILWLAGVSGLTWVEFGIRESEPTLWAVMFISVLVMNTAFAIDVYRTAPRRSGSTGDERNAVALT
jgi:hypothetical protein